MAFFCPVRIGRKKKKNGLVESDLLSGMSRHTNGTGLTTTTGAPLMGRITGSDSIETLVRVGIEKENGLGPNSKMIVLHDFHPCVDDELEVKRGQIINVLYQENDWVYVIADNTNNNQANVNEHEQQQHNPQQLEGFIPASYCAPFYDQNLDSLINFRKKLPRNHNQTNDNLLMNGNVCQPAIMNDHNGQQSSTTMPQQHQTFNANLIESTNSNANYHNYSNSNTLMSHHFMLNNNATTNCTNTANDIDLPPLTIGTTSGVGGGMPSSSNTNATTGSNGLAVVNHCTNIAQSSTSPSIVSGTNNTKTMIQNNGQMMINHQSTLMFNNVNNAKQLNSLERKHVLDDETSYEMMGEVQPFFKDQMCGRYVMLYGFMAQHENDLTVQRGEIVTVLNKDDNDWYWAIRSDLQEGFIPVSFTYPADLVTSLFQ